MIISAVIRTDANEKVVEAEIKAVNEELDGKILRFHQNIRTFEIVYPENICFKEIEKRLALCEGLATFFEFDD